MSDLYTGKFFYEILKPVDGSKDIVLAGPLPGMRFVQQGPAYEDGSEYEYIQIIHGKPVQAFTKAEILVTDRRL